MTHAEQLDRLQRWMLTAITDPVNRAPDALDELILPSRQQSAAERLAVYNRAYFARLLDVLRELLPCTRFAVGDELFDQFAVGYLQAHPPNRYTLSRLSDDLVDYLDATRPADWGRFVVELARLEQAIDRIFDAPGPEGSPPLVIPYDACDSLRLSFVPGFELHAFDHPVSTFYTEWKAGRQPPWPQAAQQCLALFRRDYVVRRFELTMPQYELLLSISGGKTLAEALIASANAASAGPLDHLAAEFRRWFTLWTANGFFASAV
jgi:putative DNA-binding protein